MIIICWDKESKWCRSGAKRRGDYYRIRIGKLYIAKIGNKRGKEMLRKELAPNPIKPTVKR